MTSPVDTSVKYFHSGMTGAPVLSGTAGALSAVLDACLVNGFGLKSVDSLVVAGNVATANISSGHSAEVGTVVDMAGVTGACSAINGNQKVTAITGTSVSFATTGLTDQTATGTITLKMAPVGWAKTFAGTNLAAYKPTDVTATGCLLRVDDTGTTVARVVGYESMSDINTGVGPFPTAAQRSGGSYWSKSDAATSSARPWILVADGRMLYFARAFHSSSTSAYELHVFGDPVATKSGDAFCCVISGHVTSVVGAAVAILNNYWTSDVNTSTQEIYVARPFTGIGGAAFLRKTMPSILNLATNWMSGDSNNLVTYPNPEDGGLYTVPHNLIDQPSLSLRAVSPGFYGCPQNVGAGNFYPLMTITGVAGKTVKALTLFGSSAAPTGVCFFDVTGPWR